jgi:RNase H-fold protein (predicted Holliday junction resolvase)
MAARGRARNPPAPSPGTSPNTRISPGIAITFWDERLSTVAAEKALLEADTTRKRRAEVIDAVAAGYILQGALDRLRHIEASR